MLVAHGAPGKVTQSTMSPYTTCGSRANTDPYWSNISHPTPWMCPCDCGVIRGHDTRHQAVSAVRGLAVEWNGSDHIRPHSHNMLLKFLCRLLISSDMLLHDQPIRGQYPGHVISPSQSEVSDHSHPICYYTLQSLHRKQVSDKTTFFKAFLFSRYVSNSENCVRA